MLEKHSLHIDLIKVCYPICWSKNFSHLASNSRYLYKHEIHSYLKSDFSKFLNLWEPAFLKMRASLCFEICVLFHFFNDGWLISLMRIFLSGIMSTVFFLTQYIFIDFLFYFDICLIFGFAYFSNLIFECFDFENCLYSFEGALHLWGQRQRIITY